MKIILLSGGSGKRLWPLSNAVCSKQFLRLLPAPDGTQESMMQRMVRHLTRTVGVGSIVIATGMVQREIIMSQIGPGVNVVTEPEHRDTFPAISLAVAYLEKEMNCGRDEAVVVVPCDPYTDEDYFRVIRQMAETVGRNMADLVLMGIRPTYPSTRFGYVVPESSDAGEVFLRVSRFTEKPDEATACELIARNAFWNGGVFAFRLGYMANIVKRYVDVPTFAEVRSRYGEFPKISFDYEVAEKASSVALIPFSGVWKDLGTWNALVEELPETTMGNVLLGDTVKNTHVINELDLPMLCVGTDRLIVVAAPDGILVADKDHCENIKKMVDDISTRPMYEEHRWGTSKVLRHTSFKGGNRVLTSELNVKAGCHTCCQKHAFRDTVWTFVDGSGLLLLDGTCRKIECGDTVHICKGTEYAVKAIEDLTLIEVQSSSVSDESDVECCNWNWEENR